MDSELDPVSGFTTDEKCNNFAKIMATAQYLDDGGDITDDWVSEHMNLILQYREWIDDYTNVNDEIQEPSFRKCCAETETLLKHLCHSIYTTRRFSVGIYHIFIRHMKQILETIYTDDELADLMGGLSM